MLDKLSKKILWSGLVLDNDDPLMLNRVRVSFDGIVDGKNFQSILDAVPNVIDGKKTKNEDNTDLSDIFKWSKIDPFCFLPLIPLFLKITPKKGEAVNLIFPNPKLKQNEQYYVQGVFTSPTTMYRQDFEASRLFATKDRIIDSKKLKNPQTLRYYNQSTDGVFPEADDVGLMGRGTCDIIVKERDVLIRAGKSTERPDSPTKEMRVKKNRSFVQLSDFESRIDDLGDKKIFRADLDIQYVKSLVEWEILNPENKYDKFTLRINVYRLPEKRQYTTKNFKIDTKVASSDYSLWISMKWDSLSASAGTVSEFVNDFIKGFNDGILNMPYYSIQQISNNFPFIFRPSPGTYSWLKNLTQPQAVQFINVTNIKQKIEYKTEKNGFGLVFSKNRPGQQGYIVTETLRQLKYSQIPTTYNISGADRLYFLSHESQIPGTEKISLDEKTVKGITQDFLIDKVFPSTNSMVRGEELLKLLNLIVQFLVGHSHPLWLTPPVTQAGPVSVQMLTTELANASNTILNQNLRIN